MYEEFDDPDRLRPVTLSLINAAADIIQEYQAAGYVMTLRQLYYQFVSRDLIANHQREYDRLGTAVAKGRLCGLLPWDALTDRTRNVRRNYHVDDAQDAIQDAFDTFKIDMWENQPIRVEVWIEKDALLGVIEPVCRELDVPFFSCRGYVSLSEQYDAAKRIEQRNYDDDVETLILHLGDHDPSGIDMTRDNRERLDKLSNGGFFRVRRIALNYDQVEQFAPPPNPAKESDSRSGKYVDQYGTSSWELDALPPDVLADLIRRHVENTRDPDHWAAKVAEWNEGRDALADIISRMD